MLQQVISTGFSFRGFVMVFLSSALVCFNYFSVIEVHFFLFVCSSEVSLLSTSVSLEIGLLHINLTFRK